MTNKHNLSMEEMIRLDKEWKSLKCERNLVDTVFCIELARVKRSPIHIKHLISLGLARRDLTKRIKYLEKTYGPE